MSFRTIRVMHLTSVCVVAAASLAGAGRLWAEPLRFEVSMAPGLTNESVTGRLYVFLAKNGAGEPRFGPNWFSPEPFFGLDVKDFRPGEVFLVDDRADGFPNKLSKLPAGKYRVQALLDHNFYEQNHANGAGNFYSAVMEATFDPANSKPIALALNQTVPVERFRESQSVREVAIASPLLSKFHGREVIDRVAVILPPSYHEQTEKRYPVVYIIPGFSGSHRDAARYANAPPRVGSGEIEFIRVMLSGSCKWGHHVYADSATNGPRGQALVEEMIPHIDRTFRTVAQPTARFVQGHSSGGWSSLWLQVTYPETFGGVWSSSPDPVTFSDFQQIDLYANPPQNAYVDPQGQRRPIARRGRTPVLWYDSFCKMDDALGRGGQLRSFEAAFSPLGSDGLPRKAWDRETGRVDPEVAKSWEPYDIRLKLERNWQELAPKLKGKLHITMGDLDTFYLEGATVLLAKTLKELNSDAEVTILAGEDHSSYLRKPEYYSKVRKQMSAKFLEHHPE